MRAGLRSILARASAALAAVLALWPGSAAAQLSGWTAQGKHEFQTGASFVQLSLEYATTRVYAGLALHHSAATCRRISLSLVGPTSLLTLVRHRSSDETVTSDQSLTDVRMERNHASDNYVGMYFQPSVTLDVGTYNATVDFQGHSSCTDARTPAPTRFIWQIFVFPTEVWADQGRSSNVSRGPFAAAELASTVAVDTGIKFHRSSDACRIVNMMLNTLPPYAGVTSQFQLLAHKRDGTRATVSSDFLMDRSRSGEDFDIRLFFRPGITVTAGNTISLVAVATPSTTCPSRLPSPPWRYENYTVTIGHPWVKQGRDVAQAPTVYSPVRLAAADYLTDTGIAFHRSSQGCRRIDVALAADAPAYFSLIRYQNDSAAAQPALQDILMLRGDSADHHVRLFFKASTTVAAGATVSVTMLATQNAGCAERLTAPPTLTVGWTLTMATPAQWIDQGRHSNTTHIYYEQRDLAATRVGVSVSTGLVFHRSATTCRSIDLSLRGANSSYFDLVRFSGNSRATATTTLAGIHMQSGHADDGSARLFYKAIADFTLFPPGIHNLTVEASANPSCTDAAVPAPQTLGWRFTLRASWIDQDRRAGWGGRDTGITVLSQWTLRTQSEATDTGVVLHRSSQVCRRIDVSLQADLAETPGSFSPEFFELYKYRSSDNTRVAGPSVSFQDVHMESGHADDHHVRVYFKPSITVAIENPDYVPAHPHDIPYYGLGLNYKPNAACTHPAVQKETTPNQLFFMEYTAPWQNQGRDSTVAAKQFSAWRIRSGGGRTDTSLAFHRSSTACRRIDVSLSSESLSLFAPVRYQGGTPATGGLSDIRMENRAAGDQHLRLLFEAGAQVPADSTIAVTVVADANQDNCDHKAIPLPLTLTWSITTLKPAPWVDQGRDQTAAASAFSAVTLQVAESATDTGLAFHRSSTACRSVDMALAPGSPSYLELVPTKSADDTQPPDASLSGVHMERDAAADHHVRLFFTASAAVTVDSTIGVTVIATPNASCTAENTPLPLTLAWSLTLAALAPWEDQGNDSDTPSGEFSPLHIAASTVRTDTGLAFHRSSTACRRINVSLNGDVPDYLELVRYRTVELPASNNSLNNIRMEREAGRSDRFVRLMFKAGAAVPDGTTVSMKLIATPNARCREPDTPRPITVDWSVTVATPAEWVDQGLDSTAASGPFSAVSVAASSARVPTGLIFHRSAEGCRRIDLALADGAPDYFELVRYVGSELALNSRLVNVPMERGAPTAGQNHNVGLAFTGGTSLTANSTISVQIIARPNARNCTAANVPRPLTVDWSVTVATTSPWENQGFDSQFAASVFAPEEIASRRFGTRINTGLIFHQSSAACRRVSLTVTGVPDQAELVRIRLRDNRQNFTDFDDIRMLRNDPDDEHVRLVFKHAARIAGPITLSMQAVATPHSSCTTPSVPAPLTMAWRVTLTNAEVWVNQGHDNESAAGLVAPIRLSVATTPTYTGQAFHRSSGLCRDVSVGLAGGSPSYLGLVRFRGDEPVSETEEFANAASIYMKKGETNDSYLRLGIASNASVAAGTTVSVTVVATHHSSCGNTNLPTPLTLRVKHVITIAKIAPWEDQGRDEPMAAAAISPLRLNGSTVAINSGVAFHRSSTACRFVDVALANSPPEHVELRVFTGNSADANAGLSSLRMERNHGDDRHVRLYYKASVSLAAGSVTSVTVVATPHDSCDSPSLPAPLTLAWSVTVGTPGAWVNQGRDQAAAATSFSPVTLAAGTLAVDTGVAFHRSADGCRRVNAAFSSRDADQLTLVRYAGDAAAANDSLRDIRMERGAGADSHLRLFFKAGATLTAAHVVSVTLVATPHASCDDPRTPYPLTVSWLLTIATPAEWQRLSYNFIGSQELSAWRLAAAGSRFRAGPAFHRNSEVCDRIDLTLVNDPLDYLELVRYRTTTPATETSLRDIRMGSGYREDHNVVLFVQPGSVTVAEGSTISITLVASANASCTSPRVQAPLTVNWDLTIATTDEWEDQGRDDTSADGAFSPWRLATAGTRIDTGVVFHRSADSCRSISVGLANSPPDYVELVKYEGDQPAANPSLNIVYMEEDAAGDQHVRLFFSANASVTVGSTIDVTVAAYPRAACTNPATPPPLTVAWRLTVATPLPWVDQGDDSVVSRGPFSPLKLQTAGAGDDTGLAFHRSTAACRRIDLELTDDAPDYVELMRYDGDEVATTATLHGIHMEKNHADDHHVRLFFKPNAVVPEGTQTLVRLLASPSPSCTDPRTQRPLLMAWRLAVATPSPWEDQGLDDTVSDGPFSPVRLAAASARTATGLAFHQSAEGCRRINVELANNPPAYVELVRYAGDRAAANPSLADITMLKDDDGDEHVRLFFKANAKPDAGSVVNLTLIATPNIGCTDPRTPAPLTVQWSMTIATPAPWVDQGRDDPSSDGPFSALTLAPATQATDTGLAFHQSSTGCRRIDLALANEPPAYVELRRYAGDAAATPSSLSDIRMEQGAGAADHHVRLFFKPRPAVTQGSTVSVTVVATPNAAACTAATTPAPLTVAWLLTIAEPSPWVDQGADSAAASGAFSALRLAAADARTATGLAFHRSAEGCRRIDVALANSPPAYVELVRYAGTNAATPASLSDITMLKDDDNDHHVRLFFKANASVTAGSTVDVTVTATPNAACTDPRTPDPLTVSWSMTVATPAPWTNQGLDDQTAGGPFASWRLAAAATRTAAALAFHQSSTACRRIDVALANSPPDYVELVRYAGANAATPAGLSDITMDSSDSANNHHVRLFFKANASVPQGTTVQVTVVATPNAACTDAATPAPLTVNWSMTVVTTAPWVDQGYDDAEADSQFSALTLATAANPTATGLAFHQSSTACRRIDVALAADTPSYLALHRYAGDVSATSRGFSNITMLKGSHADNHVRLFFNEQAAVTQGATVSVTMIATPNASCTDARTPPPLTVGWAITVATPAAWVKQGADDDSASGAFSPLTLAAASSRTATGLAFHRNSAVCKRIDVALSGDTSHVELRRYASTAEASSQALSDITMDDAANPASGNQHVRLFFKAGAAPAGGSVLNVTIVATPNAACTDPATPAPLTVAWNLTVATTSPWVNQGADSTAASGSFSALTLATAANRTATGLAFHRSAEGCRQIDVALSGDTGQVELIRYAGGSTATPAALSNITMHIAADPASSNHHVKLLLKARAAVSQGDVLSLTIVATPNSSCTDPRTPAPLTVSWNVTIATAANWVKESRDDDSASGSFSPLSLAGSSSRTATGLAFHRNSDACKRIDVALSGDTSHVELRRYADDSEASSQALSDITMDDGASSTDNQHVRLYFKSGATPAGGSVLNVTIIATPNAACTDARTPAPLTVGWNLTIASTSPWVDQGRDATAANGAFSALTLATATQRTDTGLAFHRSAEGCRQIDVALSGDTGQVELIRYAGSSAATPTSLSNITMHSAADPASSNHHVKLFLKARAAVSQGDVLSLTVAATPNSSCTDPRTPAPLTVAWNVTIATPAAWVKEDQDDDSASGSFSPLTLAAASSRTDSGLAFHRNSAVCKRIDIALSGDTAHAAEASSQVLTDITMDDDANPGSGNHHVRLFFKANAAVSAGSVLDVTIVATPNAACTDPATPAPLTVGWNLTIASTSPWVDQGRDATAASG
ncbi:MAG: hypothetical protein ISN26_05705, partial [Betaproteobacteria bacterium AqS2]|nr:hypothetical protein [Betaproteobacteria bacterium AqS2]